MTTTTVSSLVSLDLAEHTFQLEPAIDFRSNLGKRGYGPQQATRHDLSARQHMRRRLRISQRGGREPPREPPTWGPRLAGRAGQRLAKVHNLRVSRELLHPQTPPLGTQLPEPTRARNDKAQTLTDRR